MPFQGNELSTLYRQNEPVTGGGGFLPSGELAGVRPARFIQTIFGIFLVQVRKMVSM